MLLDTQEIAPGVAAKQIAEKAAAELASLESRLQELHSQREAIAAERTHILTEKSERQDHRTMIRQGLATVSHKLSEAENYASVAQGTLGEQEAVRRVVDLNPEVERAAAHVGEVEHKHVDLDAMAAARLSEIDTDNVRIMEECATLTKRLQQVKSAQAQALAELGRATYDGIAEELKQFDVQLAELKKKQASISVARRQYLDQAHETLSTWPQLQREIQDREPFDDDATSRIIASARDYVGCLLADGPALADVVAFPATQGLGFWMQALEVSREMLYLYEHLKGRPSMLRERHVLLSALYAQYVASKRA